MTETPISDEALEAIREGRGAVRLARVAGDTAYLDLGSGIEAAIDVEDVELVLAHTWTLLRGQWTTYLVPDNRRGHGRNNVSLHRFLMGNPKGYQVDHKDGDGLNNRRSNLRLATSAQNQFNQRIKKNNTSGYKGVSWRQDRQKWQVHIRVGTVRLSLGHYKDLPEAAKAYAAASAKFHGEFGRLE